VPVRGIVSVSRPDAADKLALVAEVLIAVAVAVVGGTVFGMCLSENRLCL